MPALPPLVDQHCHGVVTAELGIGSFEPYLNAARTAAASGTTHFDSQTGFAVRRWCPPLLGLEPHCPPALYLARRRELGALESTRRLLGGSGTGTFLIDTGAPGDLARPADFAAVSGGAAHEIVRLESLAEQVADTSGTAGAFVANLAEAVHSAGRSAIAFSSAAGSRSDGALRGGPPAGAMVRLAAADWLAGRCVGGRMSDPVLLRHLLWTAVATGLPLQLHTASAGPEYTDLTPLADFVRATDRLGTPLVLLGGPGYQRQTARLAGIYPHVYADIGLASVRTVVRATAVLTETLELAPFGKLLFSTGAHALPELHVVGARLFTEALGRLLGGWTEEGAWTAADAARIAALLAAGNARRLYGIGSGSDAGRNG